MHLNHTGGLELDVAEKRYICALENLTLFEAFELVGSIHFFGP